MAENPKKKKLRVNRSLSVVKHAREKEAFLLIKALKAGLLKKR